MNIIPAIDIIGGKCVRLTKGDYCRQKVYSDDPLEMAKAFAGSGLRRLHLVDLDGAKEGKSRNLDILERIAVHTPLVVDYSGGLRNNDAIRDALEAGAAMVSIGSAAVKEPELMRGWLAVFGAERVILSADVDETGHVATRGWLESSGISADDLISRFEDGGLSRAIVTEIARDGMLCGIDAAFYRTLTEKHPAVRFTASGGVSTCADIEQCGEAGLDGVIVGKAFYEGRISLTQLSELSERYRNMG